MSSLPLCSEVPQTSSNSPNSMPSIDLPELAVAAQVRVRPYQTCHWAVARVEDVGEAIAAEVAEERKKPAHKAGFCL